jgi:hypothetical protein
MSLPEALGQMIEEHQKILTQEHLRAKQIEGYLKTLSALEECSDLIQNLIDHDKNSTHDADVLARIRTLIDSCTYNPDNLTRPLWKTIWTSLSYENDGNANPLSAEENYVSWTEEHLHEVLPQLKIKVSGIIESHNSYLQNALLTTEWSSPLDFTPFNGTSKNTTH